MNTNNLNRKKGCDKEDYLFLEDIIKNKNKDKNLQENILNYINNSSEDATNISKSQILTDLKNLYSKELQKYINEDALLYINNFICKYTVLNEMDLYKSDIELLDESLYFPISQKIFNSPYLSKIDKDLNKIEKNFMTQKMQYQKKMISFDIKTMVESQKYSQSYTQNNYSFNKQFTVLKFKESWLNLVNKYNLDKEDILLFNIYLHLFMEFSQSQLFKEIGPNYQILCQIIYPVIDLYMVSKCNELKIQNPEVKKYLLFYEQLKKNNNYKIIDQGIILNDLKNSTTQTIEKYFNHYFRMFMNEYAIKMPKDRNTKKKDPYNSQINNIIKILTILYETTDKSIEIL